MRRRPLLLFATSILLAVSGLSVAVDASGPGDGHRLVHYLGRTVVVPTGWRVVDYRNATTGCPGLDDRVVYVGTPRYDDCPARVIGARHTVWLHESATPAASTRTATVVGGQAQHFLGEGFDKCNVAPTS